MNDITQDNGFNNSRQMSSNNDLRFQRMLEQLHHYNEIETEEKRLLGQKIEELKEQLEKYKNQMRNKLDPNELSNDERKRLVILQNEAKTLRFQIRTMEQDKEVVLRESDEFRQEIQCLKKEKFDKITEITNLKVELRNLEEMIHKKLEAKLQSYKRLIKSLKVENECLLQKNQVLEQKLVDQQRVNESLLYNNNELKQENELLQQGLAENLERLKDLSLENNRLKTQTGSDYDSSDNDHLNYHKLPIRAKKQMRDSRRRTSKSQSSHQVLSQPIRLHTHQQRRRELPSTLGTEKLKKTNGSDGETKLLSVRIVGKQSMLKQCYFKFMVSQEDLEDTRFLLKKACLKYCSKYSLNSGDLQFTNYKGDKLNLQEGYPISNGDIIYVNYR